MSKLVSTANSIAYKINTIPANIIFMVEWHSRGKGFDPPRLHQQKKPAIGNDGRLFPFDIIGFMSHDLSLLETHWKQIKNPLPINQEKNGKDACQERRYPGEINHRR